MLPIELRGWTGFQTRQFPSQADQGTRGRDKSKGTQPFGKTWGKSLESLQNNTPETSAYGLSTPRKTTLQGTNISPKNGILKMIFLFPRWDMLIPWSVLQQWNMDNLLFFVSFLLPSYKLLQGKDLVFVAGDFCNGVHPGKLTSNPESHRHLFVFFCWWFLAGGFLKYFLMFTRSLWKWSNLTNMFQMGWNHQQVLKWSILLSPTLEASPHIDRSPTRSRPSALVAPRPYYSPPKWPLSLLPDAEADAHNFPQEAEMLWSLQNACIAIRGSKMKGQPVPARFTVERHVVPARFHVEVKRPGWHVRVVQPRRDSDVPFLSQPRKLT